MRQFRLSPHGHGVSCDANGAFVGSVPLLKRKHANGKELWSPRNTDELSEALGYQYGVPVDVSSKAEGLAAIALALSANDIARAQIVTLQLKFPEPPILAKAAPRSELIRFIRELFESGLIKAKWDVRWPKGAPDSQGGRFAPGGSAPGDPGIGHNKGPTLEEAALPAEEDAAITLGPIAALAAAALALSTVPAGSGEDEAVEQMHMHHPWPKYLGGAEEQALSRLPAELHMQYHDELDAHVPRWRGARYFKDLSSSERLDVLRKVTELTKRFDIKHGTHIYEDMIKNGFPVIK